MDVSNEGSVEQLESEDLLEFCIAYIFLDLYLSESINKVRSAQADSGQTYKKEKTCEPLKLIIRLKCVFGTTRRASKLRRGRERTRNGRPA